LVVEFADGEKIFRDIGADEDNVKVEVRAAECDELVDVNGIGIVEGCREFTLRARS